MLTSDTRWSLAHRVGFRFVFSYWLLYFADAMPWGWLPYGNRLAEQYGALWLPVVRWVAQHVLHLEREIYVVQGGGISNTAFGTVLFFCYLALAAVATALWSLLDRRRPHYARLHEWFRLSLRFSLALAMIHYGTLKVIPTQMIAPPPLGLLTRPLGELTRMQMLWTFMGSSPLYESLTGAAELLGGVLLLVPRTVLIGGLLSAANMGMVVTLNFCYDVHVKLFGLHLLAMAVLLVAPDAKRLAQVLLLNRRAEPAGPPPPFFTGKWARPWLNRAPHLLLALIGLVHIHSGFEEARGRYAKFHPPEPPLYGVWKVEELQRGGQPVPRFTDPKAWEYVFFRVPGALSVEHRIGSRQAYALELDLAGKRMVLERIVQDEQGQALTLPAGGWQLEQGTRAELILEQPEEEVLVLRGELEGAAVEARLRKVALLAKGPGWFFDPPPEER